MEFKLLIFLILNLAITLVFITLLIAGGLTLNYTNYVATVMATGSYDAKYIGNDHRFGIYEITMDDERYETAGTNLVILSVFVLGVAVLGWIVVGSDKKRPKLANRGRFVYVVCLGMLTVVQLGVYTDFMGKFAQIPSEMERKYKQDPISINYTNATRNGKWSLYAKTVNVIHFVYECCGMWGMKDFGVSVRDVPASCCTREYVLSNNDECGITANLTVYNQHGCLRQVEFKVWKTLTVLAVLTTVVLLLQMAQVITGFFIIKENRGAKVTPNLSDGHVTDPANGPDLTKDHVTKQANHLTGTRLADQPGPSRETQNANQAAGKDENEPSKKSSRKGKKKVPSMKKKESPSQQLVEQPGTSRETPRENHVTEKESHVTEGGGLEMLPKPRSTDTRPDTLPNPSPPPPDPVRPGARSPDTTSLDLQLAYKDSFNDTEHNWGSGNIWDQFGT